MHASPLLRMAQLYGQQHGTSARLTNSRSMEGKAQLGQHWYSHFHTDFLTGWIRACWSVYSLVAGGISKNGWGLFGKKWWGSSGGEKWLSTVHVHIYSNVIISVKWRRMLHIVVRWGKPSSVFVFVPREEGRKEDWVSVKEKGHTPGMC